MIFFIEQGKVEVTIAENSFTISKGGAWQVPRGESLFPIFPQAHFFDVSIMFISPFECCTTLIKDAEQESRLYGKESVRSCSLLRLIPEEWRFTPERFWAPFHRYRQNTHLPDGCKIVHVTQSQCNWQSLLCVTLGLDACMQEYHDNNSLPF
jgi:Mif2/CENP-C like